MSATWRHDRILAGHVRIFQGCDVYGVSAESAVCTLLQVDVSWVAESAQTAAVVAQLESLRAAESAAAIEHEIEGICLDTLAELQRQGLTDGSDSFLQKHCEAIMRRVRDPQLRQMHWMEG